MENLLHVGDKRSAVMQVLMFGFEIVFWFYSEPKNSHPAKQDYVKTLKDKSHKDLVEIQASLQ